MQPLLNRLAAKLNLDPFIADAYGRYHLRFDDYSLFLTLRSEELLLVTPFGRNFISEAKNQDLKLLKHLLQQVVAWARNAPQALVLDELGNLQLQARLLVEWLDEHQLEAQLSQHITLLECLTPQLTEAGFAPQWRQKIWHP